MAQRGARAGELEAAQVRSMFDGIARVYDALNGAMTAGLHHRWRERAADLAQVGPGARVLDVATGTGDLALELARRVAPGGEVVGSDFSEGMLARAREKGARAQGESGGHGARGRARRRGGGAAGGEPVPVGVPVRWEWGDALRLPYADGSFDAATVGFGARNFADLHRGLSEMARVVRPGGRVVVLEMTPPARPPLSLFFGLWFDRVVPVLGRATGLLARDRDDDDDESRLAAPTIADAYTYLPSSVRRFPGPAALAAELERAGLGRIAYLLTAGGIISIHSGVVGGERSS